MQYCGDKKAWMQEGRENHNSRCLLWREDILFIEERETTLPEHKEAIDR